MNVAIFGAGIAGLASAITLQLRGHRCRIYERSRQAHQAGMGFIVMPEGVELLESFGVCLKDNLQRVWLDRYCHRNAAGEIAHEKAMPVSTCLRRCDLVAALLRASPASDCLVHGAELDHVEFEAGGSVASCVLASGARIEADLYVAADGTRSRAREALFPRWPAPTARVSEVVGLVRSDEVRRWTGNNFNKLHDPKGGLALGVLPVDAHHVVWFLQFDALRFPISRELTDGSAAEARRAVVEELVGGWAHPIPSLLAATDFSRVHLWRPVDSALVPRFYRRNLALTGDAAHPLLPFTSQGVSSAIADAVVLAREMNGSRPGDGLERALARYSMDRHAQRAPYVAQGRELMEHFLKPLPVDATVLPLAVTIGASTLV